LKFMIEALNTVLTCCDAAWANDPSYY